VSQPLPTNREGRYAQLAAAVLVGGSSSRMGSDKAALVHGGVSQLERTLSLVTPLAGEVLYVGGEGPRDVDPLARWVADPPGADCALRGLVGALAAARLPQVLVLAVDLPKLRPELLLALLAYPEADAVVPRTGDRTHPLCALYRREPVLEVARARLQAGELSLRGLLAAIDTAWLEGDDLEAIDPGGESLGNANTAADWRRLVGTG